MTKKKVKILAIVLSLVVVIGAVLAVLICSRFSWFYSEEQHLERITERAEERFLGEGSEYTSLEVYPVYNAYDELQYALIELAPQGYMYVCINSQDLLEPFGGASMYIMSDDEPIPWSPYRMEERVGYDGVPIEGAYEPSFFVDENGDQIFYYESHFKVAGIENERRYILETYQGHIPAVKRGDKYLDLVDGALIEYYPSVYYYPTYATGLFAFVLFMGRDL